MHTSISSFFLVPFLAFEQFVAICTSVFVNIVFCVKDMRQPKTRPVFYLLKLIAVYLKKANIIYFRKVCLPIYSRSTRRA